MVTVNKQSFTYVIGSYSAITAVWVMQRSHCFSFVAVRISLSCGYYNCLTTFAIIAVTSRAAIGHANWYQAPPNPFPHPDEFFFLFLILGFKQNYTIVMYWGNCTAYRFMPFRNHELTTVDILSICSTNSEHSTLHSTATKSLSATRLLHHIKYFKYQFFNHIYIYQVQTCPVWNWYGIGEFHLRLQFHSIPFLVETPSLAFSTHSLLKVPNSRIIPTLTFQFQSPVTYACCWLTQCS